MNRTATLSASVANLTLPDANPEPSAATEKIPTILFDPAYSGGLLRMNPDVWPLPVVFDVDGLEERPQNVPIIRDHDQNQKVGQTDAVEYDGGKIVARGRLINFGIDPAAGKVVALWKRGARLEASVATGIIPPENVEQIAAGETVAVNGQTFEGPIEIVRRWKLKEISVVTLGADDAGTKVVVGNAAGSFNAQKGKTKMRKWSFITRALGLEPTATRRDALQRIAQAASDPNAAPLPTDVVEEILEAAANAPDEPTSAAAEGADDANKTASAEGEIDPADPEFVAFAASLGIDDVVNATPELLEVAKAAFARFGAANAPDEPAQTASASASSDDGAQTASAEGSDDANKTASASGGFGSTVGGPRPWSRTKFPVDRLGSQTTSFQTRQRPSATRVAEASLLTSGGVGTKTLEKLGYSEAEIDEASRGENRNLTLMGMMYRTGAARAGYADASSLMETIQRAQLQSFIDPARYRFGRAAGELSTVDVPNVLANVMHKQLLNGILAIPDPTDAISRVVAAKDFREQNFDNLLPSGEFAEVKANGELENLKLSDANYVNKARVRGFELRLDYETIANDDMNALMDVPRLMGRKAAIRKQKLFWQTLCKGLGAVKRADKNPKFGLAGLDKVTAEFKGLRDDDGDPIGSRGKFLIVPPALETSALNIVNATQIVAAGGGGETSIIPNVNRFATQFEVVAPHFIGSGSAASSLWGDAQYMLLADPAEIPLTIMSYYQNQRTPTLKTVRGQTEIEGLRYVCWWGFGVSVADPNAAVVSTGAGS
ncbi:MAG: hypothetical protein IKW13_02585 [Thermoguttaceae bacterium]|nr:hypothetical protein [Thermoguttaceae bacterium]